MLRVARGAFGLALLLSALLSGAVSSAESSLAGMVPTRFAGLEFRLVPDFLPPNTVLGLAESILSTREEAQRQITFAVIRTSDEQPAADLVRMVADVMADVSAASAWLLEWSWVPSRATVAGRDLVIRIAEGMGYGFPTFIGVASWSQDDLGYTLTVKGAADEFSRDVVLKCAESWITGEELTQMPRRDDDDPTSPYVLFRSSRELQYFQPATAADYATKALEAFIRLDRPLWVAAAHLQLGRMLLESRDLSAAERYLTEALTGFQWLQASMGEVTALISLATLDYMQGALVSALDRSDQAYSLATALDAEPSILTSDVLTLRGCVFFGATLWHEARAAFEEALSQDESLRDASRISRDENNLAVLSFSIGDYALAFARMQRAVDIRPYISTTVRVPAWSDVQQRLGASASLSASTQWAAPPMVLIAGPAPDSLETEANLASAYAQLGLLDDARALLEYLVAKEGPGTAFRGAATSWMRLASLYGSISAVAYLSDNMDGAVQAANRSLSYAKTWGWAEPILWSELLLGRLRLASGDADAALTTVASALERCFSDTETSQEKASQLAVGVCPDIDDEDVVHWTYAWQFAVLQADALDKAGRREEALRAAECALGILERAFRRSQAGSRDLTLVWPLPWQHPFEVCVELQMATGKVEDAHRTAESAKARTFLNALAATSVLGEGSGSWVSPADIATECTKAVSLLNADEAVVEYYTTEDAVFVWVITTDGTTSVRLAYARDDLLRDVVAVRRLIEAKAPTVSARQQLEVLGQGLYDRLVLPVRELIPESKIRTLVLIPGGPLWYLPFAALPMTDVPQVPGEDGIGLSIARPAYLIEKYSLAYLPSLAALPTLGLGSTSGDWTLLGLANPILSQTQLDLLSTEGVSSGGYRFDQLESAMVTFGNTLAAVGAGVATGASATESLARSAAAESRVTAFACHGSFNALNPLYSQLYLAPSADDDGNYSALEVLSGNRMETDVVILAACETLLPALRNLSGALGAASDDLPELIPWQLEKITAGDEVVGFSQAFLSQGVHAVLGTLWQASPYAVEEVLRSLAEGLASGLAWGAALQLAQKRMIEAASARFVEPWFWAPYQLVGAWR